MQLLDHNKKTLDELEGYAAQNMPCCVVNPCGSGKTSVMAAFMRNHPDKRYLVLTRQKNAAMYYEKSDEVFKKENVRITTYQQMHLDVKKEDLDRYKADIYIADEAHYIGAERWGNALQELIARWDPLLIGFTATPQRYADQGTDRTIVTMYFHGNTAGNYTVTDLRKAGVFVEPKYILSLYGLDHLIERKIEMVDTSDLTDAQKEGLCNKLLRIQWEWEKEGAPPVVFRQHLPQYMYKRSCNRILVYVSSLDELKAKKGFVDRQVQSIFPGKSICSYVYTYQTSESELEEYLSEDDTYIKILYSIDKIMETIHIQDLRIAIMLRPSVSNRIIVQQFGRINSIGNSREPLVIDMVNNLDRLKPSSETGPRETSGREREEALSPQMHGFRYLRQVADVFKQIDLALRNAKTYTYKGFSGSLQDICMIHHRDLEDVRKLLKTYDLETAIHYARKKRITMTQSILDDYQEDSEVVLTEEQRIFSNSHLYLLKNYIVNKQIEDDDMRQELYLRYIEVISKSWDRMKTGPASSYIINGIHKQHVGILRRKQIRSEVISMHEKIDIQQNEWLRYVQGRRRERLEKAVTDVLSTLTEREASFVSEYYGLADGHPKTMESIAKTNGLSGSRVAQIIAKALRKLRHPTRSKKLKEFL